LNLAGARSERQKAFRLADGGFQNVNIVTNILKQVRKRRHQANVVFLDLAKAFDTVQHASIVRALQRKGFGNHDISVVKDLYTETTTIFEVGQSRSILINIRNGVKQGCPLSPLLSNLIMDELIEELYKMGAGVVLEDQKVAILAFADDLVLMADSDYDMQKLLKAAEAFFDARGLKVNVKKYSGLRVLPAKCIRTIKVTPHQW